MVCEYLLWLSGGWLITWYSLDVLSFVCCSMCLYSFCKWQLCSEVSKWQEGNPAADGKSRRYIWVLQRCCSQSCHFPEEEDVPAGRQQADKQCAQRTVMKRMQVNGQCLQWVRKLLTQHPNLDKMWRQGKHKVERDKDQSMKKHIQKSRETGINRLMEYHFFTQWKRSKL